MTVRNCDYKVKLSFQNYSSINLYLSVYMYVHTYIYIFLPKVSITGEKSYTVKLKKDILKIICDFFFQSYFRSLKLYLSLNLIFPQGIIYLNVFVKLFYKPLKHFLLMHFSSKKEYYSFACGHYFHWLNNILDCMKSWCKLVFLFTVIQLFLKP